MSKHVVGDAVLFLRVGEKCTIFSPKNFRAFGAIFTTDLSDKLVVFYYGCGQNSAAGENFEDLRVFLSDFQQKSAKIISDQT